MAALETKAEELSPTAPVQINWNIAEDKTKFNATKKMYIEQIPIIEHKEHKDNQAALFKVLTVAQHNNRPRLLLDSLDIYTRERIKQYTKNKTLLEVQDWVKTDPYIASITNNDKNRKQLMASAISTFYARFHRKIQFHNIDKINDLLEPFALYVDAALNFIQKLLNNNVIPPFQIDLMIIPQHIKNDNCNDSGTEEEDEEDDDDNRDTFDVLDSLSKTKNCFFVQHKTNPTDKRGVFHDLFKKYSLKAGIKQFKNYPHQKRFCIVADRRRDEPDTMDEDDIKKDENMDEKEDIKKLNPTQIGDMLYMFHPPKGNNVLRGHLPEQFIQTSSECVLPDPKGTNPITSQNGDCRFFMLSFHIEQKDEIRCYLYQRSQICRFFPSDILDVWQCLFAEHSDNKTFIKIQSDVRNPDNFVLNSLVIDDEEFDILQGNYE